MVLGKIDDLSARTQNSIEVDNEELQTTHSLAVPQYKTSILLEIIMIIIVFGTPLQFSRPALT